MAHHQQGGVQPPQSCQGHREELRRVPHVEVGVRAAPPQAAFLSGVLAAPKTVGHTVPSIERREKGYQLYMGCVVHLPAVFPKDVHQSRVVLSLTRAADVEQAQTVNGQRPMWGVEPAHPPGSRAVLLSDATAKGGRTNSRPRWDRLETCRIRRVRTDVGFDCDWKLAPLGVPPPCGTRWSMSAPGSRFRKTRTPVRN